MTVRLDSLSHYIYSQDTHLSSARKWIRTGSVGLWSALSIFVSFPSVKATLSQLDGTLFHKIKVGSSAVIVGLDWSSLSIYGGALFIVRMCQNRSEEEKTLFQPTFGKKAFTTVALTSIIFGLAQRLPTLPEALIFNKDHPDFARVLAFFSFIIEAGLPSLFLFNTFEDIYRSKLLTNEILFSRNQLIKWVMQARNKAYQMHQKALLEKSDFSILLRSHASIEEVVTCVWKYSRIENTKRTSEHVFLASKIILGSIVLISCIGLFILDALLSKTAVNYFSKEVFFVILGITLTLFPMLYGAPKCVVEASNETIDLFFHQQKTFGEYVFPVTSKCLKISALFFSFWQYYEQNALANIYTKQSLSNSFLTITNTIACAFLITKAFYEMIELGLFSLADKKHALSLIKERLDRLERFIKEAKPEQLEQLMLKCSEEVRQDLFNERTPLAINRI